MLMILIYLVFMLSNETCGFRTFDVNGVETILALENETVMIKCKSDAPMAYCGFIHPTGKRYSFSGSTLDAGQCAVKVQASKGDSGEWSCHIGRKGTIGIEVMKLINLRVVNELAAVRNNISTLHGKKVTIECATTRRMTPLKYCRFEPPVGKPFSINDEVGHDTAILNRYYFPNNKSLDRGDCAVTILKVKYEDVGNWTCGAGLGDGKEHIDTITIDVEGLYAMSKASATGITFGALGIIVVLGILVFLLWKKKRLLGSNQSVELDDQEMRPVSRRSPYMSQQGSPQRSRQESPVRSRHESPERSRHESPVRSRHEGTVTSCQVRSRQVSPVRSPQVSPVMPIYGSRQVSPHSSRPGSPLIRHVPLVVVQSPSDAESAKESRVQ